MSNLPPAIIELHGEKLDSGTLGTTELPENKSTSVGVVDVEAVEGAHTPASPRTVHGFSVCFHSPLIHSCSLSWRVLLISLQWFLMTFSILSTVFLYALDNTITADLIPVIHFFFYRKIIRLITAM